MTSYLDHASGIHGNADFSHRQLILNGLARGFVDFIAQLHDLNQRTSHHAILQNLTIPTSAREEDYMGCVNDPLAPMGCVYDPSFT